MRLRKARRTAQSACSSSMQGAARFALAAVLAVTLAYPVASATNRAYADEAQEVAPESAQGTVQGELTVIDESFASNGFLVGTARDFDLAHAFQPFLGDQYESWQDEDEQAREDPANFTVSTSDASIATIQLVESETGREPAVLRIGARGVGEATLTVQFRYAGRYATYQGEQVAKVVVSGDSNPITSLACDESVQLSMIEKCAICGETHPDPGSEILPIEVGVKNSGKPYTSDQVVEVTSSDPKVVSAWVDSCSSGDGALHVHMAAQAPGKATLTLTASTRTDDDMIKTASATITAQTVNFTPKMTVEDAPARSFALDDLWIHRSFMIEDGLVSYGGYGAQGWWPYCPNIDEFDGFKGTVNGKEVTVLSAGSDNEAVAEISGNGAEDGHRLIFSKAGTSHVTFKDIWGNEKTVTATGVSREAEAKKLSLSQNELTIKQGETIDARSVVKGWDALDPTVNTGESLVFRSSDKSIASVEWKQEADGHGQISWITGNKVGDVTMTVGLRKSAATGTQLMPDNWALLEFGTLTVHVVADEAPEPDPVPATGITLDKESTIIIGANSTKLTAAVAPENASDKSVTWTSSNNAVATVDAGGVVKAVSKGETKITATTADGKHTATCAVTVYNPITSVELQPTMDLVKGATGTLEATLKGDLPGEMDEPETLRFSSGSEDVASLVQSGNKATLTALKSGISWVRLVVKTSTPVDENTQQGKLMLRDCTVTVTNPVTSITLSNTTKTATVGDDPIQLTAKVVPSDADGTIAWSSSDAKVATVNANGTVTVKAAGSATITASAGGRSATCSVTVKAKQIATTPTGSGFSAGVMANDVETAEVLEKIKEQAGGTLNLVVAAVAQLTEPAKQAVDQLLADGAKVADTFDIHLSKDNGEEIVVGKDQSGKLVMTVKIRLTDSMNELLSQGMNLQVHYVGPDGTIEDKQTWVEDGHLLFITEHFSDYVVTGQPPKQDASGQDVKPLAKTGGSALAATGDASAPVAAGSFAALLAACGVLAVAIRKRKSAR